MSPIETTHWERIRDRAPHSLADLYDGFAGAMFSLALEILADRWEAEKKSFRMCLLMFGKSQSPIRPKKASLVAGYWSSPATVVLIGCAHENVKLFMVNQLRH